MRLNEILNNLPPDVYEMMLKLRKGASASLDTKKLTNILSYLNGWSIEKTTAMKHSAGGWIVKDLPGSDFHKSWHNTGDGRIYFSTDFPLGDNPAYDEKSQKNINKLKNAYTELLNLSKQPMRKIAINDLKIEEVLNSKYENLKELVVSFELFVKVNVILITSSDDQTFEVFGDYKNGAIGENGRAVTYQDFYNWAVENTDFMDQILLVLNMDAFEKKHNPKDHYIPPPTSSNETKIVFELLKNMTENIRQEQEANLIKKWSDSINLLKQAIDSGDKDKADRIAKGSFILNRVYYRRENKIADNWKETVNKFAKDMVEEMQNTFVYKNTRKLSPILTAKGNMLKPEILNLSTRNGDITGTLRFNFADGSSFLVDQSVVQSWAPKAKKNFYRFPTTFHDVKLPNGIKMNFPSEERMNEVFAKTK